ncbi:MAG: type III pantothenate kinase [Flavobacteriales bacterium]
MQSTKVFVLDGGNTHLKLGTFVGHQLLETKRFHDRTSLGKHLNTDDIVVIANVGGRQLQQDLLALGCQVYDITNTNPLPFINAYETPNTLGIDRLCNISAVQQIHPSRNVLVIDAGTCIKFDFIDHLGTYHGGSISPGISLRYQSLHEHTSQLPLLSPNAAWEFLGKTSEASIQSGVMGSVNAEIDWRIKEFNNRYEDLIIYLTGGDLHYFDLGQKNGIFVDENLTLKGIYALYTLQHSSNPLL